MRLTIGVIARDELPFIHDCLHATAEIMEALEGVDAILVDCASADGTLAVMQDFARSRPGVRVFSLTGVANAGCARNVILNHLDPGAAVYLVDGDVEPRKDFAVAAMAEIASGEADAAVGQLPEVFYDENDKPIGSLADRNEFTRRAYVEVFGGIVLLGPAITGSGLRYNESMRKDEDIDFSVRLADTFRIVALPQPMGVHHTIDYFHPSRRKGFRQWIHYKGTLFRRHLFHPMRMWRFRKTVSGIIVGAGLQFLILLALILMSLPLLALVVALVLIDLVVVWRRGRLNAYWHRRVVGPWYAAKGFFFPEVHAVDYQVTETDVTPAAAPKKKNAV